ncbi:DUF6233 domain-containing protein [Streptomyces sp. NPDC048612]|uniref:DUF6233 domain-containing protein n=1 Tax=Streptomyces sp. NPDC048612 TaxID=3365579 RepID=UPI0037175657
MDTDDSAGTAGQAGPKAEVCLPDGQRLRAAVVRRRRDRAGVWWYDLQLQIPDRAEDRRHAPALIARTISFSAPHPVVRPIPGEDYTSLDPPPPHERRRWRLDAAPTDGWVEFYVNRPDCAQAEGTDRLLTDQEALGMLADPDTTLPCPVCRPDRVLTVAG